MIGGSPILQFCQDSDELTSGQEAYLRSVIADARGAKGVEIHGNASTEGPSPDYNYNLACTRAASIAARLKAGGVAAPIDLYSHGPVTAFGSAAANRNVEIVIRRAPKIEQHENQCIPRAGVPNTVCGLYRAQDWWLPEAYVVNATCACRETPNNPTASCVRKFLQDRLAATPPGVVTASALMKPQDPLTIMGGLRALTDPTGAMAYESFVQAVLTPRIFKDHKDAYKTCCCPCGPAPYPAWMGVTSVPLTCDLTGSAIRLFGSCHCTPGRW